MATNYGAADTIAPISVEKLAQAALPGTGMDASSRQLLDRELVTLPGRREAHGLVAPRREDLQGGSRGNLTGIALSGGGIRSATFCLGVLQALARHDLLKRFDYLSTVSGGGYVGGALTWWWSGAWRPENPSAGSAQQRSAALPQEHERTTTRSTGLAEDQAGFEDRLRQAQAEPEPPRFGVGPRDFPYGTDSPTIWRGQIGDGTEPGPEILTHLRKHGNYLTPGGGIRLLSVVSVMLRAVLVNLFVWLPILSALMLVLLVALRWLFAVEEPAATGALTSETVTAPPAAMPGPVAPIMSAATLGLLLVDALITTGFVVVLTVCYFVLARSPWATPAAATDGSHESGERPSGRTRLVQRLIAPWGAWLVFIGVVLVGLLSWAEPEPRDYWQGLRLLLLAALILAMTFLVLCLIYSLGSRWSEWGLRRVGYRMRRLFEIWAAVYLTLFAVLAVMGAAPDVAAWLTALGEDGAQATAAAVELTAPGEDGTPATAAGGEAAGGILALLAGLVAAGIAFVRSGSRVTSTFRAMGFHVPGGVVASIAATLLLFGVVLLTHAIAQDVRASERWLVFFAVVAAAGVVAVFVNINHTSLGRFYRDRLMEAFMPGLEAVRAKTTGPAPDAADRMSLREASPAAPYHIVNTNVVLINARNRRRCIRGGDSFILTRDYCGSNATGWRATREFMDDGMTVPTAVAISGAAANPNTGVGGVGLTRSRVVSVLMALLNLRLGYWVPHPVRGRQGAMPNHFRPGVLALLQGYSEDYPFQELSDGGHFENLGIYELIRRRMRLILLCDGSQDADFQFEDLQTALRRIGEDFGAKVRFLPSHPMEDIIPQPREHTYPRALELARRGFAVANVYYPPDFDGSGRIRPDADPARLIYLNTTIVDGLPLELLGYKGKNFDFPEQSTGDQFFDEDQFEAYRELGYRIADAMIAGLGLRTMLEDVQPARTVEVARASA